MTETGAETQDDTERAGAALVDTNVFVYAYDKLAGAKHLRANALIVDLSTSGKLVLSAQVLNEFLGRRVPCPGGQGTRHLAGSQPEQDPRGRLPHRPLDGEEVPQELTAIAFLEAAA